MKKITNLFFVLFALQLTSAYGQALPPCPVTPDSYNPLSFRFTDLFSNIAKLTKNESCNMSFIFSDVMNASFIREHKKERCDEIDTCKNKDVDKETIADATKIIKESLPKAALLGVLEAELKKNVDYNIRVKKFEDATKIQVCAEEKTDPSEACKKDIRNALAAVSGVFLGYPKLSKQPDPIESTEKYFNKAFFSYNYPNKHLKTKAEIEKERARLASECSGKITFAKLCSLRDSRLQEIAACENNPQALGCLDKEQNALASLINSHKDDPGTFLEIESQLCTKNRMVQAPVKKGTGENGTVSDNKKEESIVTNNTPSADNLVKITETQVTDINSSAAKGKMSNSDEIKTVDSTESASLSESFANSMSESLKSINQAAPPSTPTNTANNSYSSRYDSESSDEDLKKKQEDQRLASEGSLSGADKKKQEEVSALTNQISGLKSKLEEMNKNLEELQAKKELATSDKEKAEKEALQIVKEKEILELKNKLAALEADKQKSIAENQAKQEEENRKKVAAARNASDEEDSSFGKFSGSSSNEDSSKVSGKNSSNGAQGSGGYSESRAPASVGGSQATGTNSSAAILLHANSVGSQAAADSAVVYMTAGELQKYPYHLNDNASSVEIEKMILGNKGAAIIVGNDEEIIPEMIKGVVQLDEAGHVKFKRVRISLVKNDKEKKLSIAREISSTADLKREDQKKRELIRYQEMKKLIKNATAE